jgi:radical SAM superfamily enzyme YgiQ (UPF0313 family)
MEILFIQPPFVQLNTPYPATAYLASFARQAGHAARVVDLSIELFHRIFSAAGLRVVFTEAERRLAGRWGAFDAPTRANLQRALSNASAYQQVIGRVVGLLSGGDDAFAHELATAGRVPWGHRAEGLLEANDQVLRPADAPLLASLIIEDVADFITFALDPEFSLVRYAETKASSQPDFRVVEAAARESFLFTTWLRPLVAETLAALPAPDLVCITIPFPGTLPGALVVAEEAKRLLGPRTPVAFGGGFVSTELRLLRDQGIFAYADYLCFDAGFGALSAIIRHVKDGTEDLHKTIVPRDGRLVAWGFEAGDRAWFEAEPSYEAKDAVRVEELRATDTRAIREVFPDFAGVDFSRYVRMVEGTNPMHALWSDTKWLKARLAHGCYWRRCAFCDTSLEYIARFAPSSPEALFRHLQEQSRSSGQHGIHFVDEAMPVPHLVRFAEANRGAGRPLVFWGNARLEHRFTADACAVLAEGGLLGVSAGLEIATEKGLAATHKGLSWADIASALVALKTNGILVHVYLMYGWPDQAEADVVDALEIVRQLFSAGLVDSAFWHKFILTRHSPLYAEWKAGRRTDLTVRVPAWTFGSNDVAFDGEDRLARYGAGLDAAVGSWMEGEQVDRPLAGLFDFRIPRPTIAADFVEKLARAAERRLDAVDAGRGRKLAWLGGALLSDPSAAAVRVTWSYRNRLHHVVLSPARAARLQEALPAAAVTAAPPATTMDDFLAGMNIGSEPPFETTKEFRTLRRAGLAAY